MDLVVLMSCVGVVLKGCACCTVFELFAYNFRSFSVQAIVSEDIEPQHLEAKWKTTKSDAILEHFLQLTCLSCGDVTVIKHCDKNHP